MAQPQPVPAPYYPPPPQSHDVGMYQRTVGVLLVLVVILGISTLYLYANPITTSVSQTADLNNQVTSLRSQVSDLQNQLTQFQGVHLKGDFTWYNDCPTFSYCSFVLNGDVANFGTTTANSVEATFTFYSGEQATGQVLCTTTYAVGTISGQSITALNQVPCQSSTYTQGQTVKWAF